MGRRPAVSAMTTSVPRLAGAHGVEDDCGRIAALLGDDLDLVAVAPDGELFAGGGSERVACGEQDALAALAQVLGDLADGGGLACAVDGRHHDDEGMRLLDVELALRRREHAGDFIAKRKANFVLRFEALELNGVAQTL